MKTKRLIKPSEMNSPLHLLGVLIIMFAVALITKEVDVCDSCGKQINKVKQ